MGNTNKVLLQLLEPQTELASFSWEPLNCDYSDLNIWQILSPKKKKKNERSGPVALSENHW